MPEDTELIQAEDRLPTKEAPSPEQFIALAIEKGMDPEGIEWLVGLYERVDARRAEREFSAALLAFQNKCPIVRKNKTAIIKHKAGGSHSYDHTTLDYLVRTITPYAHEQGLSWSWDEAESPDGTVRVATIIHHVGGHSRRTVGPPYPVQRSDRVSPAQAVAQSLSFAKRYGLVGGLGIVWGDDDKDGADDTEFIDEKQLATIQDFVDELKPDMAKFLKLLCVDQLAHLPKGSYKIAIQALKALEQKKRRQG